MIDRQLPDKAALVQQRQPMQADYSYNQWRRDQMQHLDRENADRIARDAGAEVVLQS